MQRLSTLQRHEELRKFFHITLGSIIAVSSLYVERSLIVLVLMLGLTADVFMHEFILQHLLAKNKSTNLIRRLFGLGARTFNNMNDVGRRSYGDYAYAAGIVLSALIFERPFAFIAAALVLALGDGLAGLIGRIFGEHGYSWFGAHKTYLGSAVFFLVTSFIVWQLLIASQISPTSAFAGALIISIPTTLLEAAIGYGLDNFAVPLAAGFLFELMV